jgi:hypothetical protein
MNPRYPRRGSQIAAKGGEGKSRRPSAGLYRRGPGKPRPPRVAPTFSGRISRAYPRPEVPPRIPRLSFPGNCRGPTPTAVRVIYSARWPRRRARIRIA